MPATEPMFGMTYPTDLDPLADWPAYMQAMVLKIAATMQGRVVVPNVATLQQEIAARTAADLVIDGRTKPTAWTALPLANGALPYGGAYQAPQYRKLGDVVYLRGLVGTLPANGTPFCQLPAGHRPPMTEILNTITQTVPGQLYALNTGFINRGDGTGAYITLAGLQFSTVA